MFLMINPYLILAIVLPVVLLIGGALFFILKAKKNDKKIKIDSEFINKLVSILGGKDNVLSVTNDNGRIKFDLSDLDKANLNELKELSQNGVFVTNNTVKTLFPHDAKTISNAIKQLKD